MPAAALLLGLDAYHPALSHFPIAFLFLPPVLMSLSWVLHRQSPLLRAMALWMLLAGTLGLYLAAASGDAARDVAPKLEPLSRAIATHEDLGSLLRALFTGLCLAFAGLIHGPRLFRRELQPRTLQLALVLLLAAQIGGLYLLVKVAHTGGILVHRLGLHAHI